MRSLWAVMMRAKKVRSYKGCERSDSAGCRASMDAPSNVAAQIDAGYETQEPLRHLTTTCLHDAGIGTDSSSQASTAQPAPERSRRYLAYRSASYDILLRLLPGSSHPLWLGMAAIRTSTKGTLCPQPGTKQSRFHTEGRRKSAGGQSVDSL